MIRFLLHSMIVLSACLLMSSVFASPSRQEDPSVLTADQVDSVKGQPAVSGETKVLEEVVVTGQHSVTTIRREMFNTQDLVYAKFNDLNKDDEFDMVCIREARIGSQIKYKVCRPRFMMDAMSDAHTEWRDDGITSINMAVIKQKRLRQREIMADLANKNPAFLALLKKRLALKKAYEHKQELCGNSITCLNRDAE